MNKLVPSFSQLLLAQLERSRKAAKRADKAKERAKARRIKKNTGAAAGQLGRPDTMKKSRPNHKPENPATKTKGKRGKKTPKEPKGQEKEEFDENDNVGQKRSLRSSRRGK